MDDLAQATPEGHGHDGYQRPMVTYDRRTALIVVGMQNDYAHPGGLRFVPGGDQVLEAINRNVVAARDVGALVIYTRQWNAGPPHRPGGRGRSDHCVRGTWGVQFLQGLHLVGKVVGQDLLGTGSALRRADGGLPPLQATLQQHDVRRLVLVGVPLEKHIQATALDARQLGYDVEVLLSATRPWTALRAAGVVEAIGDAGVVVG